MAFLGGLPRLMWRSPDGVEPDTAKLQPSGSVASFPETIQTVTTCRNTKSGFLRRCARNGSLALALLAGTTGMQSGEMLGGMSARLEPVAATFALRAATSGFVRPAPAAETVKDGPVLAQGALALGAPARVAVVGVTTADSLNLRQGPGTGYGVIAKLGKGTQLEVIGEGAGWYRVATARGTVGWVIDDYFSVGAKTVTPATPAAITASVGGNSVNLRSGPGTAYSSYGTMAYGTTLTVLARNGDWYKARSPRGTIGWVAASLVNIGAEAARSVPVTSEAPVLTVAASSSYWVWPARGRFTSGFGWRGRAFHDGIDIANAKWTPIVAARAGTVIQAGWCGGWGYCVRISHGDGLVTEYAHLASHPPVWSGQAVSTGRQIGYMGATYGAGGYATGVHLHFSVKRYGTAVNPLAYLP